MAKTNEYVLSNAIIHHKHVLHSWRGNYFWTIYKFKIDLSRQENCLGCAWFWFLGSVVGFSKVFVGVRTQELQVKFCPHLLCPRLFLLCVIAQDKVCFVHFFSGICKYKFLNVQCSSLEQLRLHLLSDVICITVYTGTWSHELVVFLIQHSLIYRITCHPDTFTASVPLLNSQ